MAKRDVDTQGNFFKKLGITVAHNGFVGNNNGSLKECYNADVVYGDLLNFIGDNLNDITSNVKNGRGFDIVIVDEVDNMFIDQTSMSVQTGGPIPGFEHLRKVLLYSWGFQNLIFQFLRSDGSGNSYLIQPVSKQNNDTGLEEIEFVETILEDPVEYIKNITIGFVGNFTSLREDLEIVLPKHLQQFIQSHIPHWVNSSIDAREHVQNRTYIIGNSNYYNKALSPNYVIAPVDQDTGVIQYRLNWGDGLTQFLQIKHGLKLTPEGLTSVFQSYVSYFLKYKGNIYGLTGTLGTQYHQDFLHKIYDVDFIFMPNFIQKRLTTFPEIIVRNDEDKWLEEIEKVVQHKAVDGGRAILIIAKNIEKMQKIADHLKNKGHNVKEYGDSPDQSAINRKLVSGEVIVATNAAGRGADIKISKAVEQNGGLHGIKSFFPGSIRVNDQADGRGARNGESGSVQLVINHYSNETIDKLVSDRSIAEHNSLQNDALCKMPKMLLRDGLFDKYVDLIRTIDSPTGLEIIIGHNNHCAIAISTTQACLHVKDNEVYVKATKEGSQESLKITSDLRNVDEKIYNHIISILAKPDNPTALSKRDLELVHFLLARNGYSAKGSTIIERVKEKYESLFSSSEQPISDSAKKLCGIASSIFLSIASRDLCGFPEAEIRYLEHVLHQKGGYKAEDLTHAKLLNAKISHLYELWIKDREIYNKQFDILQIQELWAMWLKDQDRLLSSKNKCDLLAIRNNNGTHIVELEQNRQEIKKLLFENFEKLKNSIISSLDNGTLFQNPAYVIRKAYDRQNVHDYQTTISNTVNGLIGKANTFIQFLTGFSLAKFWYEPSPLEEAIELLKKATNMDPEYSWQAYNGLAFMDLIQASPKITHIEDHQKEAKEAKDRFVDYCNAALKNLYSVAIPQSETLLAYILLNNITKSYSDLTTQQIVTIKIHQEISNSIEKNINIAIHSEPNQMIRVSKTLVLDKLFTKLNATDVVGKYYNLSNLDTQSISELNRVSGGFNIAMHREIVDGLYISGALAFEIELYNLEEDDDWFGTIFSGIFGIGQILLGVAMLGIGGPFATAFAYSMIAGGIGDVLSSTLSVLNDAPINLDSYLRAKAISLAVSIVVSGIAYLGHTLGPHWVKLENFPLKTPNALSEFMVQQVGYQVALLGAATVIQNVGNQVLNANDGLVENQIREAIETLINTHYQELKVIFASDQNEGTKLLNKLLAEAYEITQDYAKRFNSDFATVLKSVVPSAVATFGAFGRLGMMAGAVATAGSAAVNIGLGVIKVDEATDDFTDKFGLTISRTAAGVDKRSKHMMQKQLENSFTNQGQQIMDVLAGQGFVNGMDIDYNNCERIDGFALQSFEPLRGAISSSCKKIADLMSDTNMQTQRDALLSNLKNIVFGNAKGMTKSDIISPFASSIGNIFAGYIRDQIKTHQETKEKYKNLENKAHEEKAKQEEERKERTKIPKAQLNQEEYGPPPPPDHDLGNKPIGTGNRNGDISANKDSTSKATTRPIQSEADKFFTAVEELAKAAEVEKNQCPIPKQSYKHGWIGEASDSAAAWIDGKIDAVVDGFLEASYELGKSVAQNDPLHENTITFPKYEREYSQGVRNIVNEGFEVMGIVTNEVLKSVYSSRPTDVFLDSSELKEQIAQRRNEYNQAMDYVGQKLNEHTTYGERRLVEIGLTFTGVGKVVHDTVKYGELFGHRHIIGGKYNSIEKFYYEDFNTKLQVGDYGKPFSEPPYGYKEYVLAYQTNKPIKNEFIRLFDPAKSKPNGAFIMHKSDFHKDINNGLSILQIADKYGIPYIPTKTVGVELESGINMAVGQAGKIKFNFPNGRVVERAGGGRQYQILQYPEESWFPKNTIRGLDEYIKDTTSRK